jgi:ArsR family transcriptional regulator
VAGQQQSWSSSGGQPSSQHSVSESIAHLLPSIMVLPSIVVDALCAHPSTDVNARATMGCMPTALLPLTDLQSCCSPITREAMGAEAAVTLARALKALADPARLRLLSMVSAHADGEACVCDLTEPLGLSQPTVSHHLKVLVDAGFLARSKRGTWAYYRLVPGALDQVAALLANP